MNRKTFLSGFSVAALVAVVAFLVLAASPLEQFTLLGGSVNPQSGRNISGTLANLSAQIGIGSTQGQNYSVTNVTFMWQLTANNSIMANLTVTNGTNTLSPANQTHFNRSGGSAFDTTTLPDGIYNLSLMIYNFSGTVDSINQSIFLNESVAVTVIVDNTRPLVSVVSLVAGPYTATTYNLTFNASVRDNLSIQSGAGNSQPGLVNFRFDNASGVEFNVSVENKSGHWSTVYNVSSLAAGYNTITVKTNDTAGNQNGTQTWTILVNTAHNVTWNPTYGTTAPTYAGSPEGQNISGISQAAHVLNVSVKNSTAFPVAPIRDVFFMFDNASGVSFNLTNTSGAVAGQYYNLSVNLSNLVVGNHLVVAHVNDTRGNFNNTEFISFTVNNNPANVSWNDLSTRALYAGGPEGQNFSARNSTVYFNVSVTNQTGFSVPFVIFWFDNATGNDFNLTNGSAVRLGQYWNVSYNVSALAEGTHKVYVLVNDTKYNKNYTEFITFKVDKSAPTFTFTVSPSSPEVGNTVTVTCNSDDSLSGLKITERFSGDTDSPFDEESTTASSAGEKTSSSCTATDHAGNAGSKTHSYTVVESTADSGSSSGGSGGGGGGSGSGSSAASSPGAAASTGGASSGSTGGAISGATTGTGSTGQAEQAARNAAEAAAEGSEKALAGAAIETGLRAGSLVIVGVIIVLAIAIGASVWYMKKR